MKAVLDDLLAQARKQYDADGSGVDALLDSVDTLIGAVLEESQEPRAWSPSYFEHVYLGR